MSTIRLIAKPGAFSGGAPSYSGWKDSDGQLHTAMPHTLEDGSVTYDIPDHPSNRSRIRTDFEPSGLFSAELVHVDPVLDFKIGGESADSASSGKRGRPSKAAEE